MDENISQSNKFMEFSVYRNRPQSNKCMDFPVYIF